MIKVGGLHVFLALSVVAEVFGGGADCRTLEPGARSAIVQPPLGGLAAMHQEVSTASAAAQTFYDLGVSHLAHYAWIEAARAFQGALREDSDLALAHLGLARAYLGMRDFLGAKEEATLARSAAARRHPTAKEMLWIQVVDLRLAALGSDDDRQRRGWHSRQQRALDSLLALDPRDAHAWLLKGNLEESIAWGIGQLGDVESIAPYAAALLLDPGNSAAHHFLAHTYENLGEYDLALGHARSFQATAPRSSHAQHMVGHILPAIGRWDEALARLVEADRLHRAAFERGDADQELDWHYGHNLRLLAAVHHHLGNLAAAEDLYRETFALEYPDWRAGFYCAPWVEFLLVRERYAQALEAARSCRRRSEPFAHVVGDALAGEALLGLGRPEDAGKALDAARTGVTAVRAAWAGCPLTESVPWKSEQFLRLLDFRLRLHAGSGPPMAMAETIAEIAAGHTKVDGWAQGLLRLERLGHDARKLGNSELAEIVRQRQEGFGGTGE